MAAWNQVHVDEETPRARALTLGARLVGARRSVAGALLIGLVVATWIVTPRSVAAATLQTYYFHGAGGAADDANRVAGTPTATFNQSAPTGTGESTQTGTGFANPDFVGNPLGIYWVSSFAGTVSGTVHLDWYWSTANPEVLVTNETVTVSIFGDGSLIGRADVPLSLAPTPVLNHTDVTNVAGSVFFQLIVQVTPDFTDAGTGVTAHYDSVGSPSSFQAAVGPLPTPTATPPPCLTRLCFSTPVVLPKSAFTGSTNDTCFNPCGEPSLVRSPVDGTLYVSTPRTIVACCNTQASPVWKSTDNGATWSNPIFPSAPESVTTGGDTELAVDKRGAVYEGELWLGDDSIYISQDAGQTWSWSPASHNVLSDREWFAYAPGEDALYGWYDGFNGLMVVKAPLGTPAGSTAASFFPIERLVVPECTAGLATNCPNLPANTLAGTPIIDGTVSPGRPSISPVDGTLYFPFPYQVAGQGIGIASTSNGGLTFNYGFVSGAGQGTLGDTGNDFPVSAVDAAGTLYVAWVENKGDGFNVYLASSTNKGQSWTAPFELSNGISRTAVFPNIVAGAAGQVAVSWYGSSTLGDPNDTTGMANAKWNVYATQIVPNGTSGKQRLVISLVQQNFHTGPICTTGTNCTGTTRKLLDFFDMKFDSQGELGVIYARDTASGGTEIPYSRQVSGCILTTACAPGHA